MEWFIVLFLVLGLGQAAYHRTRNNDELVSELEQRLFHTNYRRHQANALEKHHVQRNHHVRRTSGNPECVEALEIVFVLDESGSIWGPDFDAQLDFVNAIIDEFKVEEEGTHVGVMTFATETREIFYLGDYVDDVTQMKSKVSGIQQLRGNTHTDEAIRVMHYKLFSDDYVRPDKPKIGIIITDGASEDRDKTVSAADAAKDAGITLFAIGVGRNADFDELELIASDKSYAYMVDNYGQLIEELRSKLPKAACEVTTVPPPQMINECDGSTPLDILFAAPDEAGVADTFLTLDFVTGIVDSVKVSSSQVQVGMTPRQCMDKDELKMNLNDAKEPLLDDIWERALTSTLLAEQLIYIMDEGFTPEAGDRAHAGNVAILVVDNRASDPDEVLTLADDADQLGISLITVGVGQYVDMDLLQQIATSDDHVFHVNDYTGLASLTEDIKKLLCSEATF